MHRSILPAALALAWVAPAALHAQEDRFELGLRLRRFEKAVDAQTDPAARKRTIEPLKQAMLAFFTAQTAEAGRQLDRARLTLASDKEPTADILWADSLLLRPTSRLLDASANEIPCTLAFFYPVKAGRPENTRLRLALLKDDKPAASAVTIDIGAVPLNAKLPFKDIAEGDYVLTAEIVVGDKVLTRTEQTVSLAAKLDERLDALQKAAKELPEKPKHTDTETVRKLAALLNDLRQKKVPETNFPAARLLAEAEAALETIKAGKEYYGQGRTGQFWLALATQKGTVQARLQAPEAAKKGKPLPLVVVLHGVGGSENFFFDAHGNGLVARLCEERGWLLVAPRDGLAPGVIEEVSRLYPVDPKRIFLLGHSLGATRAAAAVSAAPERFAAVAALGGGGGIQASEALKAVPFFIGIGAAEEKPLAAAAKALHESLKKAEVEKVVFREYTEAEHLLVVQFALPDVFAFFDETAKR
jgi:predicted esterase